MSEPSAADTITFLKSIWPSEGDHWYCIALKLGRGMHHQWFRSIDEAGAFAFGASQRRVETYHACAVYRDPNNRKAANAAKCQTFWLDLDVGKDKPYADDRTALTALVAFCNSTGLPTPLLNRTGGGWHVYWPLASPISAADWIIAARVLKENTQRHNFEVDQSRTADIASILRPVGTSNFKRSTPELVVLRHSAGPFDNAQILYALQPLSEKVDNSAFEVHATHNNEPSYGTVVAQHCGQMARLRDTAGNLPEPEWYAGLCVLAGCEDGAGLAQEWSRGHPDYSERATSQKFEHAGRDSGPTTCERFRSLNSAPCAGCPHAGLITSPIQLGRVQPAPIVEEIQLPPLSSPFRFSPDGQLQVKRVVEGENGENAWQWETFYKAPLFLNEIRRRELTGEIVVVFKHRLPQEGWHDIVIPWVDRSQKAVINSVASQGVNNHRDEEKTLLHYIQSVIDEYQARRKYEMEYAQLGWREDYQQFLLGNELFSIGGKSKLVGVSHELMDRSKYLNAIGSYSEWRSAAQTLFAHEQQGLLLVAGFASTLMRFVDENASAIIATVGEARIGKSMGLIAARTIWGDDKALDISLNDSTAARFRMCAVMNGLPITWDDMRGQNDPEILKQFIHSFTQGRDKNRLDRGGSLRPSVDGWSTILIATSNLSIAALVGLDGETAQQARILEYRFQKMPDVHYTDGQELTRRMRANRGTAGRRWIQVLMMPGVIDYVRYAVPAAVRRFERELKHSEASFYSSLLGCIAVAGSLLNHYHMLEFSTDHLLKFAISKAKTAVDMLVDGAEKTPAYIITQMLNTSLRFTLVVEDAYHNKKTQPTIHEPADKLCVRRENGENRAFIERGYAKRWCVTNNVMFPDLEAQAKQMGILRETHKKVSLGAGTMFNAGGQVLAWEIVTDHQLMGGIKVVSDREPAAKSRPTPQLTSRENDSRQP